MVSGKIKNVPDRVCYGCPQNWNEECRAYHVAHSKAEWRHRAELNAKGSYTNCEFRPPHKGEKYVEAGVEKRKEEW